MIYHVDYTEDYTELTYDSKYLDNDLKLNTDILKNLSDDTDIAIKYNFKRTDPETKDEKIYIVANCAINDLNISCEELLLTEKLGEATKECYFERKVLDESEYIVNCKNTLKSQICKYILNEKAVLTENAVFECIGCIYANNKKVGFFEKLQINKINKIEIFDITSLVNILNISNMKIEAVINEKWKINISSNSISKKNDHYILNVTKIEKIEIQGIPEEFKNLKFKSQYSCEDDFVESRKSLINEDLIEDNYNLDFF